MHRAAKQRDKGLRSRIACAGPTTLQAITVRRFRTAKLECVHHAPFGGRWSEHEEFTTELSEKIGVCWCHLHHGHTKIASPSRQSVSAANRTDAAYSPLTRARLVSALFIRGILYSAAYSEKRIISVLKPKFRVI
jgi:hypothetical protein